MSKIDDKLNEVLGIAEEPNELEVIQKETKDLVVPEDKDPDIDFETRRKNLYNLKDKGNEPNDGILKFCEIFFPELYPVVLLLKILDQNTPPFINEQSSDFRNHYTIIPHQRDAVGF